MRKILMTFILCLSVLFANAQIATQNSNVFDNISIGVTAGVSTPLDFNSMFPINPNVGLKVQKDFTPAFGIQVEGLAILNDNHFADAKTMVKATNIGANAVFNLSNIFFGYKGTPRIFEMSAVGGLGWLHEWNGSENALTGKTGLDLALNIGKTKAHSIVITPAIYWNLNKFNKIQFNKKGSQLAINVSYIYHFKTSNGTHHFKTYDVGAMIGEINRLNDELAKKPTEVVVEKVVTQEVPVTNNTPVIIKDVCIFFAQNSAELSNEAKAILDEVSGTVDITAYASPEGNAKYNQTLSEKRAKVVADYLISKGVKVASYTGLGCVDKTSNRVAIVSHE